MRQKTIFHAEMNIRAPEGRGITALRLARFAARLRFTVPYGHCAFQRPGGNTAPRSGEFTHSDSTQSQVPGLQKMRRSSVTSHKFNVWLVLGSSDRPQFSNRCTFESVHPVQPALMRLQFARHARPVLRLFPLPSVLAPVRLSGVQLSLIHISEPTRPY